jgi:uroporphyrinogen decarboxylase
MTDWMQFSLDLYNNRRRLHEEAETRCKAALERIDRLVDAGADFILLVNDVAGNSGPFISPAHFAEIVTPYLERQVRHIKDRGAIAFVHSDGMLMPILDQFLSTGMDVLVGVDPMAGMDIAEVKTLTYGRCSLMGNVQCSLLQDGPGEKIRRAAQYCLEHGSPGGGYIFATSNTIFPGMPLAHYECMLEVLREFSAGRA